MLHILRGLGQLRVQSRLMDMCHCQLVSYSMATRARNQDPDPDQDPFKVNQISNIIRVPVKLKKKLDLKMEFEDTRKFQKIQRRQRASGGAKSKLVIECRRPEFNHYRGQSYSYRDGMPMATKGWGHRKSHGDFIKIKPLNIQESGFSEIDSTITFEDIGIEKDLAEELESSKGIKSVASIQGTAIPVILKGGNFLITAETGCGKTLAYLLPILQNILKEKTQSSRRVPEHMRGLNEPHSYIICPSRDLAYQIYEVAQPLAKKIGVSVKYLQGGNTRSKVSNPPTEQVDLVISTVDIANAFLAKEIYNNKSVQQIVIDEADTLLDDSFSDETIEFLKRSNCTKEDMQVIFVSATMPVTIEEILRDVINVDELQEISSPSLHKIHPNVPQTFFRLRKMDKPDKLLEICKKEFDLKAKAGLKIFCNKTSTCLWMRNFLKVNGFECVSLNSSNPIKERRGLLNKYNNDDDVNIIVCTDLGSRGIDCKKTRHVLNYDFPISMADYIHRCGRTGRIGSVDKCEITNFVSRPAEIPILNEIEIAIRKEIALKGVDGNIKKILNQKYGMYKTIQPDEVS